MENNKTYSYEEAFAAALDYLAVTSFLLVVR